MMYGDFMRQWAIDMMTSPLKRKTMMQILYDVEIRVAHDSDAITTRPISVDIFEHAPDLIDVTSQEGGSSLSVSEARQLIDALQKAIEMIEAK